MKKKFGLRSQRRLQSAALNETFASRIEVAVQGKKPRYNWGFVSKMHIADCKMGTPGQFLHLEKVDSQGRIFALHGDKIDFLV